MVKGYFRRNHCSKEYVLRSKEFAKSTVASVINQIFQENSWASAVVCGASCICVSNFY